jgi:hypothetical protein
MEDSFGGGVVSQGHGRTEAPVGRKNPDHGNRRRGIQPVPKLPQVDGVAPHAQEGRKQLVPEKHGQLQAFRKGIEIADDSVGSHCH